MNIPQLQEFDELTRKLSELGPPKVQPFTGTPYEMRAEQERLVSAGKPAWDLAEAQCACQKSVPVTNFRVFHSGLAPVIDNICPGCRSTAAGMALIVCPRCRAVVARIAPHKDATGFKFEPDKCYHVDCCPVCEPDLIITAQQPTFILEVLKYRKENNLPLPTEWKNRIYKKTLHLSPLSA
jgi:hypothetical protein